MLYMVHCIDKKDNSLRDAHLTEHRAYLESQPLKIFIAGPLMDDSGAKMVGGVIIFDCESREQVEDFLENEPFNKAGLFSKVNVHRWEKRS